MCPGTSPRSRDAGHRPPPGRPAERQRGEHVRGPVGKGTLLPPAHLPLNARKSSNTIARLRRVLVADVGRDVVAPGNAPPVRGNRLLVAAGLRRPKGRAHLTAMISSSTAVRKVARAERTRGRGRWRAIPVAKRSMPCAPCSAWSGLSSVDVTPASRGEPASWRRCAERRRMRLPRCAPSSSTTARR